MRNTKIPTAIAALALLGFIQPAFAATAPAKARAEMSAKHHRVAKAGKPAAVTTTTVKTTKTKP